MNPRRPEDFDIFVLSTELLSFKPVRRYFLALEQVEETTSTYWGIGMGSIREAQTLEDMGRKMLLV